MTSMIRKLIKDRRGNALAIACAAMPLVVGAAGLATDTIQWTLWKRQLQRAADSAALAGVYDRSSNSGATTTTLATVQHDVEINNHTWMSLKSGYPTTTYPADTALLTNQVGVTLAVQEPLPFSSLFMSTPPIIYATSRAASVSAGGSACMQALETSATAQGITNIGNTTVTAPTCILYSNSPSANSASAGGSSLITAKAVAAVGGISQSKNWIVKNYIPYSPPLPDPFAGVSPDPGAMNCTTAALTEDTDWSTLPAGTNCFSSISTKPNKTLNVPAGKGPIYVNGGNVDLKGNFNCSGCTIVLTNKSTSDTATIGTLTSNAQAQNNITAPTSGTFKGIAIYQDRRATAGTNKVNGGSNNVIQGAVYFPKSILQVNGTGDAVSLCAMWVAKNIQLIGTSTIKISSPDDSECSGSGMPKSSAVRMVRLVA